MKELRDGESNTATRPLSGVHMSADKLMQERNHLQHLVSSSTPSPPFSGLSLSMLNPALAVFDSISARVLASYAASNSARFQFPIPMAVPGSAQPMYHSGITGPVTGLPAALPNGQLEIFSWVNEHSSKDDHKISGSKIGNKKKDTNWSVNKANKRNKPSAQNGLISSENHIDIKKDLNSNKSDTDINPTNIPTDKTSKAGHKKDKNGEGQQANSNNKRTIPQQSNQQSRDKVFICPRCNRCFGYKHVLQNHERTHTGEKPFECNICHKKFTRDHHLKTHMRLHTGEKPYQCSHCDRQFVQVANLRRHLRVHTGERPYACEICVNRFSDSNQLKAHMLIHKGEKPFLCKVCSRRFRRRHHLLHHKCNNKEEGMTEPFPLSFQEISPSVSHHKRERKPSQTRRIIRVSGLPVSTVGSTFLPGVPEQTHPEDLSISGNGIRNRHYSGSHSSCSVSPSPPSGGSRGSLGPYCHSITSSEPPEYFSDEERSGTADSSSHGKNESDEASPSQV